MKLKELISIVNGKVINNYKKNKKQLGKFTTDSRTMNDGDVFITLQGKAYDAHDYLDDVLKKHPSAILVDKDISIDTKIPIIKVDNTFTSLIDIGKYLRELYNIPLVAITGSVGKTMTKELISNILEVKYSVLKSKDSYNNHIGIPKTLFELNKNHQLIVMELGSNNPGEINNLAELSKPTTAVITNIGTSHIGNFGSRKSIFKEKTDILNHLDNGKLVTNGDDKYLKKLKSSKFEIYKCGLDKNNDLVAYNIKQYFEKTVFSVDISGIEYKITLNVPGVYLINNVLLAIKVGLLHKIDILDIINIIEQYHSIDKRMNVYNLKNNNTLIEDCYNSSYESLIGVINLIKKEPGNKLFIVGDILELGKYSKHIHQKIWKELKKIKSSSTIFVGVETSIIKNKENHFLTNKEVIEYLEKINIKDTIILVKGSRRLKLEEIANYIKEKS